MRRQRPFSAFQSFRFQLLLRARIQHSKSTTKSRMNFDQLVDLCRRTHEELGSQAIRAADAHLVVRNWLFGLYITEFEQNGTDRAAYGARVIESLADRLSPLKVKGTSATRLKLYRSFYRIFSIGPTLSDQLQKLLPNELEKSPVGKHHHQFGRFPPCRQINPTAACKNTASPKKAVRSRKKPFPNDNLQKIWRAKLHQRPFFRFSEFPHFSFCFRPPVSHPPPKKTNFWH